MTNPKKIAPGTRIGHVHLKVSVLQRSLDFYCGMLGFELMQRMGNSAAFISAGGYHHHIGLNTWETAGGEAPPIGTTGLYHLAILYPSRAELGDALRRVIEAGIPLDGAANHGISEALYLRDPDDNGVELYWDRPEQEWPRDREGKLAMFTRPLDVHSLLAEADAGKTHVAELLTTAPAQPGGGRAEGSIINSIWGVGLGLRFKGSPTVQTKRSICPIPDTIVQDSLTRSD